MDASTLSKFKFILSNIKCRQNTSKFDNLYTVVTFVVNSDCKGGVITPFFRLSGSELMCHIKMEFRIHEALITLVNKFEEALYEVRPMVTSILINKDEELEELRVIGSSIKWSLNQQEKYFNSIGFFEIQFTIHYVPTVPLDLCIMPKKSLIYEHLFEMYERKFTDLELIVENKRYAVHKIILARSPVFKAMFQHEMQEKYQNVVTITGVKPTIFEIILKFLYIGEIDDIQEINKFDNKDPTKWKLANILKAADMYQIDDMKAILGYVANKFINVNNVAYYLYIALEYNTNNLKHSCVTFIKLFGSRICHNQMFKEMMFANPNIQFQLIQCLLEK
ncbi:PREDICTED: TD and POZ domain-containing protein 1-like [Polistes dominula]|uniref:TD and POZ domain-containing protein 1-like n=1 Tax=Polistes dominula TaxID=743375 RepID=A0ABM1HZZ9_POLDO|nr:PREDICTED: TD and POZ domain-containing protein 1-like [Polistes dominula]